MRHAIVAALLLVLSACAGLQYVDLVEVRGATVKVAEGYGHGSGTFISRDTVLTAAHVVRPEGAITLEFPDGSTVSATRKWVDDLSDAALLTAGKPVSNFAVIDCRPLRLGDRVFSFGNPGFMRFVLTEGIVAGTQTMGAQKAFLPEGMPLEIEPMVTVSANWEPGDSGAAVFDMHGRVRGVVSIVFGTDRGGVSNNALITPVTVLPQCRGVK